MSEPQMQRGRSWRQAAWRAAVACEASGWAARSAAIAARSASRIGTAEGEVDKSDNRQREQERSTMDVQAADIDPPVNP